MPGKLNERSTTNKLLKTPIEIMLAESSSNQLLKRKDEKSSVKNTNNKIMLISSPLFQNLDFISKNDSNAPLILSSNNYKNTNQNFLSKSNSDSDDNNTPIWSQNDENVHMSSILDEFKKTPPTFVSGK